MTVAMATTTIGDDDGADGDGSGDGDGNECADGNDCGFDREDGGGGGVDVPDSSARTVCLAFLISFM